MWRRQSRGRGVKWALTAAVAMVAAIGLASCGSSRSGTPADHPALLSTPISSTVPTTSAAAPATTVAPSAPRSTPAPATTKAPAPSTPRTSQRAVPPPTTAAPPVQHTSAPAASCYPLTNSGNCYEPGEFCRNSDHGAYGIAGNGERIVCVYNNRWRWEPA